MITKIGFILIIHNLLNGIFHPKLHAHLSFLMCNIPYNYHALKKECNIIIPIIDKTHTLYLIKNNKWDEIIQKYNKRNFSKFKNTKVSNSELLYLMNRVNKYKKIYSCIIIQKYYRRHLINNSVIL